MAKQQPMQEKMKIQTQKMDKTPQMQGNEENGQKKNQNGIAYGLLAFLTALIIMLAVVGGAFYVMIHNNVNGLAEKFRPQIQGIPVLRLALPMPKDPDNEKYLTNSEVREKYEQLRKDKAKLETELSQVKADLAELQKYKEGIDRVIQANEDEKLRLENLNKQLEQQKSQMEDDKAELDKYIANGDKEGFKAYFEKVDKENAAAIYEKIMMEQKTDEEAANFAKLYVNMDPAEAAKIFENLGKSKIDLILGIFKNMKNDSVSQILAEMDKTLASQITEEMAKLYIK